MADISPVTAAVAAVNAALNAMPNNALMTSSQTIYTALLTKVATEVSNLNRAGATFNAGSERAKAGFAERFPSTASDKTKFESYEIFAKLITNNAAGDTLRVAIAEEINTQLLGQRGVGGTNDPDPSYAMAQANRTGVSVNTYNNQNK